MPKKKREPLKIEETAAYIAQVIDREDWPALLKQISFCRDCPSRPGVVAGLDDLPVDICGTCPLRPLMYSVADLVMRQRAHNKP